MLLSVSFLGCLLRSLCFAEDTHEGLSPSCSGQWSEAIPAQPGLEGAAGYVSDLISNKQMLALICCYSDSTGSYVQGTQKAPQVSSGCKWSMCHSSVTKRQKEQFIFFSQLNTISARILSWLDACNAAHVSLVGHWSLSFQEDQAPCPDRRSQAS